MSKDITINIVDIKTHEWATFEEKFAPKISSSITPTIEFRVDADKHLVGVLIELDFMAKNELFAKIKNECIFSLNEGKWDELIKDEKITIPGDVLERLLSISIGTTRGVVHAQSTNSAIGSLLTPIIPMPQKLNDMEMALREKS